MYHETCSVRWARRDYQFSCIWSSPSGQSIHGRAPHRHWPSRGLRVFSHAVARPSMRAMLRCMDPAIGQDSPRHRADRSRPDAVGRTARRTQIRRTPARSAAVSLRHLRSAPILAGRARVMALVAQTCRFQALSPIKLNDVEAHAIARPDKPDHLNIEVGLRPLQRQCEKELAEGCDWDIELHFALQLQALTIDDGGMEDAAIRRPGQIAATIAGGRPRFPTDGYICDMAFFDLIAVNPVSARHIGIARRSTGESWRGFRVAVIDPPIGLEVPVSFAHAVDGPRSIEREPRDPVRRTSDRPIGTPSSRASTLLFIAAGGDITFTHVLRRTVVAVIVVCAHRPFVDVEADIEALARGSHQARSEIDAPLQEARRWSDDGDGVDQAQLVAAQRRRSEEPIIFGSIECIPAIAAAAQLLRLAACYFDGRRALGEAILTSIGSGRRFSRSILPQPHEAPLVRRIGRCVL